VDEPVFLDTYFRVFLIINKSHIPFGKHYGLELFGRYRRNVLMIKKSFLKKQGFRRKFVIVERVHCVKKFSKWVFIMFIWNCSIIIRVTIKEPIKYPKMILFCLLIPIKKFKKWRSVFQSKHFLLTTIPKIKFDEEKNPFEFVGEHMKILILFKALKKNFLL
jgi:hypothetical protein